MSNGFLRDAITAKAELADELYLSLGRVLATRNAEAKAALSLEVARDNYSNFRKEKIAHTNAVTQASVAERCAQELLAKYEALQKGES